MVVVDESQPSLSEVEYSQRRRVPKREAFLDQMDRVVPWTDWVELIRPFYYDKSRGRKPIPVETMLRMYLLQVWFHLSDEGVEDQINDSFAMRVGSCGATSPCGRFRMRRRCSIFATCWSSIGWVRE